MINKIYHKKGGNNRLKPVFLYAPGKVGQTSVSKYLNNVYSNNIYSIHSLFTAQDGIIKPHGVNARKKRKEEIEKQNTKTKTGK